MLDLIIVIVPMMVLFSYFLRRIDLVHQSGPTKGKHGNIDHFCLTVCSL
jgi:hypothetical protein